MGDEHRCEWREKAEGLEAQLSAAVAELATARATIAEQSATLDKLTEQVTSVQGTLEKLQRHVFG